METRRPVRTVRAGARWGGAALWDGWKDEDAFTLSYIKLKDFFESGVILNTMEKYGIHSYWILL